MNQVGKRIMIAALLALAGIVLLVVVVLGVKQQQVKKMAALQKTVDTCCAQSDYQGAVRALDKLIALNPDDYSLYVRRGELNMNRLKRYDEAIFDYETAISKAEKGRDYFSAMGAVAFRTRLATAYYRSGQYAKGIAMMKDTVNSEGASQNGTNFGDDVYNGAAWILATCPDATVRDGKLAVQYATVACEKSKWKKPGFIDTLAAAYAASGNSSEAVRWQRYAIGMLTDSQKITDYNSRLTLYQSGKIYTEVPD